ncbi:MAG: L-2-amino-thiazoline-4-carboxylic acid hydrolase [Clostridiaceae bacterium]|jgi:hypothetical protein|nr:L-2-amino-thiazoline-4-carboxylic acid hydrolase [Clostridiaceae bacterium]
MSAIKNEAKIKNPIVKKVREQLGHRAEWLYYLCDEAEKQGLDPKSFAPAAITRCGNFHGTHLSVNGTEKSLKSLKKKLFSKAAQWMFEMEVTECRDDLLTIDFHYCPLVDAWKESGADDATISFLCDCAMCGDAAIARAFGAELELPETIARGSDVCKLRFVKK